MTRRRAVLEREISLGAIGEHLDRGVGAGQARGEPRQRSHVTSLGGEFRQQRAQPRTRERHIPIGRILGKADAGCLQRGDEPRFRDVQKRARQQQAFAAGR